MKSYSSEFDLYESILSGSRQRFLPGMSSSNIHFEEIIKEITTKKDNKLIKPDPRIRSQLKLVDESSFKSIPASDDKLIRSKDSDIPHPPDPKAEYFLSLIENEFDEIKKRAHNILHEVQKEKQISQFANQNIQKAKKLAIDSGHLNRLLKSGHSASLDDSDSYIINILGLFLIRSILYYQNLFEPFLKNPLDTENELQVIVDNPYAFMLKGDYWKINFNKDETLIKNLERIRYIVHLLENPNKELYCHELTSLVKGKNNELPNLQTIKTIDPIESDDDQEKRDQKINFVDIFESDLPPEELKTIKNVANQLWEKLNDPNLSDNEKSTAQGDWEKAVNYYSSTYGILLKSTKKGPTLKTNKRLKKDFERARSNVTKHIIKAIKDTGEKIPSLSSHLKNAISTGVKCCYQPDSSNPIKWTILWNN